MLWVFQILEWAQKEQIKESEDETWCHPAMSMGRDTFFGDPQWNDDKTKLLQSKLYFNVDTLQIRSTNKSNVNKAIFKKRTVEIKQLYYLLGIEK